MLVRLDCQCLMFHPHFQKHMTKERLNVRIKHLLITVPIMAKCKTLKKIMKIKPGANIL